MFECYVLKFVVKAKKYKIQNNVGFGTGTSPAERRVGENKVVRERHCYHVHIGIRTTSFLIWLNKSHCFCAWKFQTVVPSGAVGVGNEMLCARTRTVRTEQLKNTQQA